VVEATVVAAEVVWAPVEAETALVTVVEAEPWNDARHSAQEAHSPRAPPVQESEKPVAVEALDGVERILMSPRGGGGE
jgi:hypothetical protein